MASSDQALPRGRRVAPTQERSAAKVSQILRAARAIMSDEHAELTARELEARVDFSIGTVYRYFESIDAIVDTVLEEHALAIEAHVSIALEQGKPASLGELFTGLVAEVIDFYRAHPEFTQLQLTGDHRIRNAAIEEASNARLVDQLADVAVGAGWLEDDPQARTRLRIHWDAVGAALAVAFAGDPDGDETALAEASRMAEAFAAWH